MKKHKQIEKEEPALAADKATAIALALMMEDVAIALRHPGLIDHSPDIVDRATRRLCDVLAGYIGEPMTPKLATAILEMVKVAYGAPRPFGVR